MGKRARGRPAIDDDPALWAIAMKLVKGEVSSIRAAVLSLPEKPTDIEPESYVQRLRGKWKKKRKVLWPKAEATLRQQKQEMAERRRMVEIQAGISPWNLPSSTIDFQAEIEAITRSTSGILAVCQEAEAAREALTRSVSTFLGPYREAMAGLDSQADRIAATLGGINSTSNAWTQLGDSAEMIRRELARSTPSIREIERLLGMGGPTGI